jgi:complex III assembly factor LYRM7
MVKVESKCSPQWERCLPACLVTHARVRSEQQHSLAPARRQADARAGVSHEPPITCTDFFPEFPTFVSLRPHRPHPRSMSREMALVAYRNLLRSARIAFQGGLHTRGRYAQSTHTRPGDLNVLVAARAEVRKNFEADRHLQAGSDDISKKITHAQEVAKFLRENVVQGEATDDAGNYSTQQSPAP